MNLVKILAVVGLILLVFFLPLIIVFGFNLFTPVSKMKLVNSIGVSECKDFPNVIGAGLDDKSCRIYPSSLILILSSEAKGFKLEGDSNLGFMLSIGASLLILGIVLMLYSYISKNPHHFFIGLLLTLIGFSLVFISSVQYGEGDILCYSKDVLIEDISGETEICHTLYRIEDGKIVLKGSANSFEDIISEEQITGKVVFVFPPPLGGLVHTQIESFKFFGRLFNIVKDGGYTDGTVIID